MVQSSAIDTNPSLPLQTMGLGSISLTPVTTPTTTPSMANIASLTGIPSPPAQQPVIIAQVSQYHPFSALGGSQLMAQETRVSSEKQDQCGDYILCNYNFVRGLESISFMLFIGFSAVFWVQHLRFIAAAASCYWYTD